MASAVHIQWVGHACFRVFGTGLQSVVLDPYHPETMGMPTPSLSADVVIASSLSDMGHGYVALVHGRPHVIDALAVARGEPQDPGGVSLVAVETREAEHHPTGPDANAIYALRAGDCWVAHLGDVGQAVPPEALAPLVGRCDVLLAPTGAGLTIDLDDLDDIVESLDPTWIVPMHYGMPGVRGSMLPVDAFLDRRSCPVVHSDSSVLTITAGKVPPVRPTIVVLRASCFAGG